MCAAEFIFIHEPNHYTRIIYLFLRRRTSSHHTALYLHIPYNSLPGAVTGTSINSREFRGGGNGTQVSKTQVRLENIAGTRLFFNPSPR